MNKRLLKWLTIIVPVGFFLLVLSLTEVVFFEELSFFELLLILVFVSVGSAFFSAWVFGYIDRGETEIKKYAEHLEALNKASIALTTELDLSIVLQKVVDLSRTLVNARYGALGVLNESGKGFEEFISSGISEGLRKRIGLPPHGEGLFRVFLEEGRAMRVQEIGRHNLAEGFPDHHPSMRSLLGVPIIIKGKIIGDLYLADKQLLDSDPDSEEIISFTEEDQQVLELFANQAAIAIENARLLQQLQQLAVLEERERFGMDLHDGVIQSIYAVGLTLGDMQRRVEEGPEFMKKKIDEVSLALNQVTSDIRNYILDLKPHHFQDKNVVEGVQELAKALRANTFIHVDVEVMDFNPKKLSTDKTLGVLHIAKEALTNIQKHARASEVKIFMGIKNDDFELIVADNGISFDNQSLKNPAGNGLHNMLNRASALGGNCIIGPGEDGGTSVFLQIPIN